MKSIIYVLVGISLDCFCFAQTSTEQKAVRSDFFVAALLPGSLGSKLDHLGARWQKAGQERVTYGLTLSLRERGQDKTEQAVLTLELPNRVSLERPGNRRIGDDGEETWRNGASGPDDDDLALLESFGADSVEGLFESVRRGAALQYLGGRYRLEGATQDSPVYDVYAATVPLRKGKRIEFATKTYLFNSQTGLLEIVRYEGARGAGLKGGVETRFAWQRRGTDLVLLSIQRREAGQVVAQANITAVSVSAKSADGKFKP